MPRASSSSRATRPSPEIGHASGSGAKIERRRVDVMRGRRIDNVEGAAYHPGRTGAPVQRGQWLRHDPAKRSVIRTVVVVATGSIPSPPAACSLAARPVCGRMSACMTGRSIATTLSAATIGACVTCRSIGTALARGPIAAARATPTMIGASGSPSVVIAPMGTAIIATTCDDRAAVAVIDWITIASIGWIPAVAICRTSAAGRRRVRISTVSAALKQSRPKDHQGRRQCASMTPSDHCRLHPPWFANCSWSKIKACNL